MDYLTVKEYAEKYKRRIPNVYELIRSGKLETVRDNKNQIKVADIPPPLHRAKFNSADLNMLDDYDLGLIWLNATIMGYKDLIIRSKNGWLPKYLSQKHGLKMLNTERPTLKISSITLCDNLRKIGFTGRQDNNLQPPPINDFIFCLALIESRTSLGWALQYEWHHPKDKAYAYYIPKIQICASPAIMERFTKAMCSFNLLPPRKLTPAANRLSATLTITSNAQLQDIYYNFAESSDNNSFWDSFRQHISQPTIPYYNKHNK